ncbi:MAG: hypothetical protein PHE67_04830 [Campylobacterales bacterium]|nr:hypothetical protein [Campylobacterales bacterium]
MEDLKNILQSHLTALRTDIDLLYAVLSDSQKAKIAELRSEGSIQKQAQEAVALALTLLNEQKLQ